MTTEHPVDALVVDTSKEDKIGYVMGHEGPYVQLRAPGGELSGTRTPRRSGRRLRRKRCGLALPNSIGRSGSDEYDCWRRPRNAVC